MAGSGLITRGIAGEALGNRQLVYEGADGYWHLADADDAAYMPVIGITLQSVALNGRGQILLHGYVGLAGWTWTTGGLIYASTTPGGLTQTAPAGIGDYVQVVAVASAPTPAAATTPLIYFNPFPPSEGIGSAGGKSRWYPAPNPDSNIGDHTGQVMADGTDTYIRNEVYIPYNFHNLVECHVIVVQGTTAAPNMVWTCDTDWGQICVAEDYLANSDSASGTTSVPIYDLVCIDISGALTGIAAEDLVGVSFMRDGNNASDTVNGPVFYLGIRLRYT